MNTIRLYFVTWNVATKSPSQDLNLLLDFPSKLNKNKVLPDFFIIGLQEVKSQPQNLLMDTLFTDSWTAHFNNILCRQGYIIAKSIRLQGILLIVYTQMKHITHLREVEAQYTRTGLGGMWGNKGAVSVRFSIYGCSICIVNCHLTAHEHLLADRINDYNTILKQHTYHVGETTSILFHDYVFWIGDLNFRTERPVGDGPSSSEILSQINKVEKNMFDSVLKLDQLLGVMESGEAFSEFTEPGIQFPPTYKYNIGTDEYDTKRKPSWTDRILYKVNANNYENVVLRTDLVSYNQVAHYTVSDHKPVVAEYNIKTFSDYIVKTVEFEPITTVWYIGDTDFRTRCTLSADVVVYPNDWIGIFDANFRNLDDYIAYEYLSKVSIPESSASPGQSRSIVLSFPVGCGVRIPGFYRFIYFSQPDSNVRSVLGMSQSFEVSRKEDSLISIDPCVQSTSTHRQKPTTVTTDVFTNFTGLDVSSLSQHFSNDLTID